MFSHWRLPGRTALMSVSGHRALSLPHASSGNKIFLANIPPKTARELGATWDAENLAFFTCEARRDQFSTYLPCGDALFTKKKIFVPLADKAKVRARGGRFDPETRAWYAPAGVSFSEFTEWSEDKSVCLNIPPHEYAEAKQMGVSQNATGEWCALTSNTAAMDRWGGVTAANKVYLNVQFEDNAQVKALGARWCMDAKQFWFDSGKLSRSLFERWIDTSAAPPQRLYAEEEEELEKPCYLKVPFAEKDEVKALGARFDGERKRWYFDEYKYARDVFAKWEVYPLPPPPPIAMTTGKMDDETTNKHYLQVPFSEKDEAKALGARWCAQNRLWYYRDESSSLRFAKWPAAATGQTRAMKSVVKHFLLVPFAEKDEAKALGAKFDGEVKKWYFDENAAARAVFAKWESAAVVERAARHQARRFLNVSFADNDEVKRLGARFDVALKQWYFDENACRDVQAFAKWMQSPQALAAAAPPPASDVVAPRKEDVALPPPTSPPPSQPERILLHVPFSESEEVRELGAQYCQDTKKWFVVLEPQQAKARFAKWLSRRKFVLQQQASVPSAVAADALPSVQQKELRMWGRQ